MVSLLLSLLLALLLLMPAAAEDAEVNAALGAPYAPVITKQPKGAFLKFGDDLQLEVEAQLPEAGGELSYAWYQCDLNTGDIEDIIGRGPVLDASNVPGLGGEFSPIMAGQYCAVVTNTYVDEAGVQRTSSVKSTLVKVKRYFSYFAIIKEIWSAVDFPGSLLASPLLLGYSFLYTLVYPVLLLVLRMI